MLRKTTEAQRAPTTWRDLVDHAASELRDCDLADPRNEARALVCAVLGIDRHELVLNAEQPATKAERLSFQKALTRRMAREPLSRIVGKRDFYGRTFEIDDSVLDPRPDTETLIDATLELVDAECWREKPINILDVGTGSGCIIITLLAELPQARGLATDISADALKIANQNAISHGVEDRLTLVHGQSLDPVNGTFNILVSNPPYVPSAHIDALEPEVSKFEPRIALDGGPDGLNVYRQILRSWPKAMRQGWLVFEVGAGQSNDLITLLKGEVGRKIRSWLDLEDHVRCVAAWTQ